MRSLLQYFPFSILLTLSCIVFFYGNGVFTFISGFGRWLPGLSLRARDEQPKGISSNPKNIITTTNNTPTAADATVSRHTPVSYITVPGSWERRQNPNLPQSRFDHYSNTQPGQIVYVTKGRFIAWGGTAILEHLLSGDVIKTPKPHPHFHEDYCRNMRIETQIYRKIGEHPRFPKIINWDPETCCLTMEYLHNGDLDSYIRQNKQNLSPELCLSWVKQAAEGLVVLHSVGVVHCDISPRNFLLDRDLNLKISDFGGASLSGSEPSAVAGTRFRHPNFDWDVPPTFGDDLFSLGSLIYFIMTGDYPYADRQSDEVETLYMSEEFPDVTTISCGSIIQHCWTRNVSTALEAYNHIETFEKSNEL